MIKKIAVAAAVIGIVLYCLNSVNSNFTAYSAQLRQSRSDKNRSFRVSENSPLAAAQKAQFDSLKYYPAGIAFDITADISRNARPDTLLIQMSDNKAEKYLRWGQAKFTFDSKPQQLALYVKATGLDSTLFVPFTDLTNGHETYGGGRYLDAPLPKPDATEIELDFNRAYNPYCAYNSGYSCPVPPAENHLQIAIAAGEKSFHE